MKTIQIIAVGILTCSSTFAIESTKHPEELPKVEDKASVARDVVRAFTLKELDDAEFHKSFIERIDRDIPKLNLNEEDEKKFRNALIESLKKITNETLTDMLAKPYEAEFTIEQLRAIRDFYLSEAGKALLRNDGALKKAQDEGKRALMEQLLKETANRIRDGR